MKPIRLTKDAQQDLKNIQDYTRGEFGREQTKRYMRHLREGFKHIRRHPEIGFPIDHLKTGYRCFAIEYHKVFYTLTDESIAVVAVLHESQLPMRHLKQRKND
ncbi:MAG: type II toxin-antitoxin system RelE/ParE family toxin [Pseudomonadota bacterium]